MTNRAPFYAPILIGALAFAVILLTGKAALASNFTIKTPTVAESGGQWHVKVRIDLSHPPSMMHIPMRLTFSKQAVDERAILSKGAEPVHHRVVLDTSPKKIVSMDVDFADPSGKVFKSTYFEFDLSRADGDYFEAGEYQVTLSGADGNVGSSQKLTLTGDNPTVYRGAMDFTDPKAAKKRGPKMENVSNGLDAGDSPQNDTPSSPGAAQAAVAADGPAPDMVPQSAFNKTAEEEQVSDHPKGCGCTTAGARGGSAAGAVGMMLGLALVLRRRRR